MFPIIALLASIVLFSIISTRCRYVERRGASVWRRQVVPGATIITMMTVLGSAADLVIDAVLPEWARENVYYLIAALLSIPVAYAANWMYGWFAGMRCKGVHCSCERRGCPYPHREDHICRHPAPTLTEWLDIAESATDPWERAP